MKISFYISSMSGGGAERVLLNMMNFLVQEGNSVDLLLNRKEGPLLHSVHKSIDIIELPASIPKHSVHDLRNYIKKYQPDVILSTLSHCNIALLISKLFTFSNTKIIVREASSFISSRFQLNRFNYWKDVIRTAILYRIADLVLVNSQGSKDELISATGIKKEKVRVLYNALDFEEIYVKATLPLPQEIKMFTGSSPYLTAAGRLEYAKGFEDLIDAFFFISDDNLKLVILGEGKLRDSLEKQINKLGLSNKIMLPGHVANPYPVIRNSDMFVLSSRFEGMPNVLLEALSLNVPVIATNCPNGPEEVLQNGRFGSLVPVGDIKRLQMEIEKNLTKKRSINNISKYLQKYSISNIGTQLVQLLQELTALK